MSFLHLSVASSEGFTVDIGFVTGASFVIFCFSFAFCAPLISHNESLIISLMMTSTKRLLTTRIMMTIIMMMLVGDYHDWLC